MTWRGKELRDMDDASLEQTLDEMHRFLACESQTMAKLAATDDCCPNMLSRALNRTLTYAYAYRVALTERKARLDANRRQVLAK